MSFLVFKKILYWEVFSTELFFFFWILSVFCGTWNVNGETPPDSVQMWFDQVGKEDEGTKTSPDIIVIG